MTQPKPQFAIFFGDTSTSYEPAQFHGMTLLAHKPFSQVGKQLGLSGLVFLHQVHGADGLVIKHDNADQLSSFVIDGDYLLTNVPSVGLGISTADCLPVVLFDPIKKVIGNIHVGWRGARAGILEAAIKRAQQEFGSQIEDLVFYFGPNAHACCYEVKPSFIDEFAAYPYAAEAFREIDDRLYFDLPKFAALQLQALGVTTEVQQSPYCTICTPGYCSVRKHPASPMRQMTVATLTNFC